MKKIIFNFVLLMVLLLFFDLNIFAQNNGVSSAKSSLSLLLELSKTKSYNEAAKFIAYRGTDKERDLKTQYNPSDRNELSQVRRIVNKISALLQLSSKYEIGEIAIVEDEEFVYYNAEVYFTSGEQKLTTIFKLVKTDSGYLLYDMD